MLRGIYEMLRQVVFALGQEPIGDESSEFNWGILADLRDVQRLEYTTQKKAIEDAEKEADLRNGRSDISWMTQRGLGR